MRIPLRSYYLGPGRWIVQSRQAPAPLSYDSPTPWSCDCRGSASCSQGPILAARVLELLSPGAIAWPLSEPIAGNSISNSIWGICEAKEARIQAHEKSCLRLSGRSLRFPCRILERDGEWLSDGGSTSYSIRGWFGGLPRSFGTDRYCTWML